MRHTVSPGLALAERIVQNGLLVLVALMPFHAFLSVWLGSLTGQQTLIQGWKEALLIGLCLLAAWIVWQDPIRLRRLQQPWVYAAVTLVAIGIVVTSLARPGLFAAAFGIKTDLEFLAAAIITAVVASKHWLEQLLSILLISASIVVGFGLLQIFILPPDLLTSFGYGPDTIVPYQHITEGTSALRFPATLGGPNQLGTYLMLPLCLSVALFIRHHRWTYAVLFAGSIVCLVYTFSRSAWIGAFVAVTLTAFATMPARLRKPTAIVGSLILVCTLALLPVLVARGGTLQYFILHASLTNHDDPHRSDSQHAESLSDGAAAVWQEPLGHGLGTAGPATFHVGSTNIIENYYLQIGYEMGIIAVIVFVILILLVTLMLFQNAGLTPLAVPLASSIIGISLVALVLPAWVDSTTALITWIAVGGVAGTAVVSKRGLSNV